MNSSFEGRGLTIVGAEGELEAAMQAHFREATIAASTDTAALDNATHLVHVGALLTDASATAILADVAQLLQSVLKQDEHNPSALTVSVITRGSVSLSNTLLEEDVPPNHAGVWGLARTARTEEPSLKLRCIDVGGFIAGTEDFANVVTQWVLSLESSPEMEVAVRDARTILRAREA